MEKRAKTQFMLLEHLAELSRESERNHGAVEFLAGLLTERSRSLVQLEQEETGALAHILNLICGDMKESAKFRTEALEALVAELGQGAQEKVA